MIISVNELSKYKKQLHKKIELSDRPRVARGSKFCDPTRPANFAQFWEPTRPAGLPIKRKNEITRRWVVNIMSLFEY